VVEGVDDEESVQAGTGVGLHLHSHVISSPKPVAHAARMASLRGA
jgi:hypothetical protein